MGGYSELIKSFDKTRDYIRDFFIYGFKVRSDFSRKSSRTYDDERRRAESWLGEIVRHDDSYRGRQVSISVDSGHIGENPLYRTYYSKSFTDNDIKLHFMITDILSDGGELTLKEIVSSLDERFGILFDEQTVRCKLKEYTAEGIYLSRISGKKAYFSLSPHTADSLFSIGSGIADAVSFFSEMQPFGVIGNSIMRMADMKNRFFFFKHNYIVHTLEDVILPEIFTAMEEKRSISVVKFGSKNEAALPQNDIILPMQILVSAQTGRRYLAGYVPSFDRFASYRLDFIKKVRVGQCCKDYDLIKERYEKSVSRCFGVSFGADKENNSILPLKITFRVDEKSEDFIISRLEREKRCGVLSRTGDDLYTLTLDVSDPVEPMNWVKSFIGRIVSVEGGSDRVRELFYSDIKRMREMYADD